MYVLTSTSSITNTLFYINRWRVIEAIKIACANKFITRSGWPDIFVWPGTFCFKPIAGEIETIKIACANKFLTRLVWPDILVFTLADQDDQTFLLYLDRSGWPDILVLSGQYWVYKLCLSVWNNILGCKNVPVFKNRSITFSKSSLTSLMRANIINVRKFLLKI